MSDSIWNDPRITAYVLDELSEDDRQEFEAELEGNSELAAAVDEARSVTGRLEGLFASESTGSLDDDRREAIVAGSSKGSKATVAPASERSWRTPLIVLATAASLLVLVGGPMLSRQQAMKVGKVDQDWFWASKDEGVATDQELSDYGKEAAKGQALEGFDRFDSNSDVAGNGRPVVEESLAEVEESAPVTGFAGAQGNPAQGARPIDLADGALAGGRVSGQQLNAPSLGKQVGAVARGLSRDQTARLESMRLRSASADAPASSQPAPEPALGITKEARRHRAVPKSGKNDGDNYSLDSRAASDVKAELVEGTKKSVRPAVRESNRSLRTYGEQLGQQSSNFAIVPAERYGRVRPKVALELPQTDSEFGDADPDGIGPGRPGDKFEPITDNPFKRVAEHAMSTFSVNVDTASYSKTRDFLARANQLPQPDAVRIEELINYFDYDYDAPTADDEHPFTTHTVVTSCPWNKEHRLARIALKGKVIEKKERPKCNLVFLLDTSGSMNAPNKLPLVVEGMQMLLDELQKKDRVAITVYAGSAGLVLDSTRAKKKNKIRNALTQLSAGGSTNGGAGIALAYQTARDNFISGGVNRVILCTDGDFNVGTTGTDALVRMVEKEAKGGIFLSVLGFGMGNHNDSMLEQISGRGNGNYAYIDNQQEARKVLVEQTNSTLVTIAKDVKLQIEFNPNKVSSYRLIGYENRVLAKEDFNDDKKDAGEIGAGHAVTALYEIVPVGVEADESRPKVDDLKYQSKPAPTEAADSDEMMTLKLRYKAPDGDTSTLVEFPVTDDGGTFADADKDVRFTTAVAGFGMQLRRSEYKGSWTLSDVRRVAESSKGEDETGLRSEFIELVQKASELMGQE